MTISPSNKNPGAYFEVVFGVGPATAGDAPRKVCCAGHKTSSGSAAVNVPVQVFSEDEARTLFGQGSELHLMIAAALMVYPGATLWAVPLDEPGGGTAATKTIAFTSGPASADGTVVVEIAGTRIEVAIASGLTATQAAESVRDAILDLPDLPVTASATTGTTTITHKTKGTRGNRVSIRSSGSVTGLSITHASGYPSNGAGTDTLTTALAAMAPERFHLIAVAHDDATTLASWRTHVLGGAVPTEGRRQQVVAATIDTLANAITLATGLNSPRLQVAWHYNADDTPSRIAAAVAAFRAQAEEIDPAAPMSREHGSVLPGIRPQPVIGDRPESSETMSALNNGLTPISLDGAGNAYIHRGITTRSQDTGGAPNYAVLDTAKVTVPDYIADDLAAWWPSFVAANPKFRSVDDPAGDPPPAGVATPGTIRVEVYARLLGYEDDGLIENVAANEPNLVVTAAASPAGRATAKIPADVIEGLYQFDATIQQIG